jgi:hypothetical protein
MDIEKAARGFRTFADFRIQILFFDGGLYETSLGAVPAQRGFLKPPLRRPSQTTARLRRSSFNRLRAQPNASASSALHDKPLVLGGKSVARRVSFDRREDWRVISLAQKHARIGRVIGRSLSRCHCGCGRRQCGSFAPKQTRARFAPFRNLLSS